MSESFRLKIDGVMGSSNDRIILFENDNTQRNFRNKRTIVANGRNIEKIQEGKKIYPQFSVFRVLFNFNFNKFNSPSNGFKHQIICIIQFNNTSTVY